MCIHIHIYIYMHIHIHSYDVSCVSLMYYYVNYPAVAVGGAVEEAEGGGAVGGPGGR